MTNAPNITVVVNFHREQALAIPALASLAHAVAAARADGLTLETIAILDRTDDPTRHNVAVWGSLLDRIEEVSFGDLGLSRNVGIEIARGQFLTFLDGDDLWGAKWVQSAYRSAMTEPEKIWHPEWLYYFAGNKIEQRSATSHLRTSAKSFFMKHHSSDAAGFDEAVLLLCNVWTANSFASKDIFSRYPYRMADRTRGFGIEDWSWNLDTLWHGVPHDVVPGTVHLIRLKDSGSLNQRNDREGLLPTLPVTFVDWPPRTGR